MSLVDWIIFWLDKWISIFGIMKNKCNFNGYKNFNDWNKVSSVIGFIFGLF